MKSQKAHEAFETLGVITQRLETVVSIRQAKAQTAMRYGSDLDNHHKCLEIL